VTEEAEVVEEEDSEEETEVVEVVLEVEVVVEEDLEEEASSQLDPQIMWKLWEHSHTQVKQTWSLQAFTPKSQSSIHTFISRTSNKLVLSMKFSAP
jgi:hypothetical protein